jgi:hypothetical protein
MAVQEISKAMELCAAADLCLRPLQGHYSTQAAAALPAPAGAFNAMPPHAIELTNTSGTYRL